MSTEAKRRANQKYYYAHRGKVTKQRQERRKHDAEYINALRSKRRQENRDAYLAQRRTYYRRIRISDDPHDRAVKQKIIENHRRYYWKYQEIISERRAEKRKAFYSLDFEWQGKPLSERHEYAAWMLQGQDTQVKDIIESMMQDLSPEQVTFLDTLMDCDFDMSTVASESNMTIDACLSVMESIRRSFDKL